MGDLGKWVCAVCAASSLSTASYGGEWQYAFAAEHKMHVGYGPASTGTQGVTEIVNRSCHEKIATCTWSMSVAIPCKFGEYSLGVVVLPKMLMPKSKEEAHSFLRCGGPNSGFPGAFVYLIEEADVVQEMVKVNGPVVMRVGSEKGRVMDVTFDFRGAASVVARAEAGLRGRQ